MRHAGVGAALSATGCGRAAILELMSVGPRVTRRLAMGDGAIRLEVGVRGASVSVDEVERWTRRAALMVRRYAGRFVGRTVPLRVVSGGFGGVAFGQHTREGRVLILLGAESSRETLERDPILLHELLHTAFPRLAARHAWMREGLSTYLETLLRRKAGVLSETTLWRIWARSMPRGVPGPNARGLDRTRGWASTYWGGALFWLVTDVALHERGHSVSDVLRAVLDAGADSRHAWPMPHLIEVVDGALGHTVFGEHYRAMALRPHRIDVPDLLARLGVVSRHGELALSESAPLSGIRRSLEAETIDLPSIAP